MPSTKKALVIGVNYAGSDAELRGCVNDALHWVQVLTKHCGFNRRNVVAMIDEYPSGELVEDGDESYSRPTKENILEALDWLVQDVVEGDVVLFAFSGHGAQVPDGAASKSSEEKLDEAICPVDWDEFEWGVVPYRLITDEMLHQYFAKLPSGALLTVVLDACIVGHAMQVPLRIDFEYPDREIENEEVTQSEYRDYSINCDSWLQNQHVNALPRRLPCEPQRPLWLRLAKFFARDAAPPLNEGLSVFCITACRSQQTALDVYLDGASQGCMSYCMMQVMEQLSYRCTYLELCECMMHVAKGLKSDMPYMDQFFQLSYGKNAGPDECLMFDPASAFVAKDRARRRRGQRQRA
eukprot:gnl/TRDRNA2_/TRDRNA2_56914_c0_seq1.p1 gnl/TRDRNA2_/TRDRNA2_56914_c0~~gnl/TRDRNA2_/TRDRNA2_56914_c0_seq1.p1  ORF type:complete len:352 (+),score=62.67 gnl/TRDRNA2_/TRDRNA2_56914_c0_seq1:127-1182(+)